MKHRFSFWKTAGMIALAALPMTTSGCRSMGSSSWGMPSFSSWNPWKKSSTDLAQAKPSNQVPTPPAAMMAGAGSPRPAMSAPGMTAPAGYPTAPTGAAPGGYAAAPAGYGRPAGYPTATNPNGYAAQQTSAVQPAAGYNTGSPYAMGAPAGSAAPAGYGQPNYATADQRSAAGYSAGGYGAPATAPSYGAYSQPTQHGASNTNPYGASAAPAGYSAPAAAPPTAPYGNPSTPAWNTGSKNSWSSPGNAENNQLRGLANSAAGSTAMPPAASTPEANSLSSPTVARSEGAYRPGSTGRSTSAPEGDVQPAAYNSATANSAPSSSYQGAYPNTGAAAPSNDAPLYR